MDNKKIIIRFYDDKTILLDRISFEKVIDDDNRVHIEYFCHDAEKEMNGVYIWDKKNKSYLFQEKHCENFTFENDAKYYVYCDSLWNATGCPKIEEVIQSIVYNAKKSCADICVIPYTVYGDEELNTCSKLLCTLNSKVNEENNSENLKILEGEKLLVSDPYEVIKKIKERIGNTEGEV